MRWGMGWLVRRAATAPDSGFDSLVSDPRHPVPYRHRPIPWTYSDNSGWTTWFLQDQRFVADRPDVLVYETRPLDHDVTLTGAITAHLFAATTGSDADWVVKLMDVYPDTVPQGSGFAPRLGGYELMVANDVFRGRFRTSYTTPQPITPNHVDEYRIDLHTQDDKFLKGHQIMVQVQSTWFPIIDRNPQRYVPNIFQATDADFRPAGAGVPVRHAGQLSGTADRGRHYPIEHNGARGFPRPPWQAFLSTFGFSRPPRLNLRPRLTSLSPGPLTCSTLRSGPLLQRTTRCSPKARGSRGVTRSP